MAALMMIRQALIRFLSGRSADTLFGAIADLRSFGRKASLRMRIPIFLRRVRRTIQLLASHQSKIRPQPLTERSLLKQ